MQPTFHARFITNNQYKKAYLCNGKIDFIEKIFQYDLKTNFQQQSFAIDSDNINSIMQLKYIDSSSIILPFKYQNKEFKLQLDIHLSKQTSTLRNSLNWSNSIISNDTVNIID